MVVSFTSPYILSLCSLIYITEQSTVIDSSGVVSKFDSTSSLAVWFLGRRGCGGVLEKAFAAVAQGDRNLAGNSYKFSQSPNGAMHGNAILLTEAFC